MGAMHDITFKMPCVVKRRCRMTPMSAKSVSGMDALSALGAAFVSHDAHLSDLEFASIPDNCVCMQSISGMDALSALVASVSHNALASALPGKPPSTNQQQFNGDAHS